MNSSMMDCTITARLECIENYKDAKHEAWIYMCKRTWISNMKISKLSYYNSKYHLASYFKLKVSYNEVQLYEIF